MVEEYEFFVPKSPGGFVKAKDGTKYRCEPVLGNRESDDKEIVIGGSFTVTRQDHFDQIWAGGLRGIPKTKSAQKKPKWTVPDPPGDTAE